VPESRLVKEFALLHNVEPETEYCSVPKEDDCVAVIVIIPLL